MLKVNKESEIGRPLPNCDCNRYVPPSLATINEGTSEFFVHVPREGSTISLKNSYLEIKLDVLNAANGRYGGAQDKRLANLSPTALFSENMLTTTSTRQLEKTIKGSLFCV